MRIINIIVYKKMIIVHQMYKFFILFNISFLCPIVFNFKFKFNNS